MYDKVKIKVLFMDVDGTLTDGKIYTSETGEFFKAFSIKDGSAILDVLPKKEIIPVVITGKTSKILEQRCKTMGVSRLYQGISDKRSKIIEILEELNFTADSAAYIGDDDNDLDAMSIVAVKGCPKDASELVLSVADFISKKNGGEGAVREFIDWLIKAEK